LFLSKNNFVAKILLSVKNVLLTSDYFCLVDINLRDTVFTAQICVKCFEIKFSNPGKYGGGKSPAVKFCGGNGSKTR
jgi:hypothetical protein